MKLFGNKKQAVVTPTVLAPDLTNCDLESVIADIRVSEAKKDEVQAHLAHAVTLLTSETPAT